MTRADDLSTRHRTARHHSGLGAALVLFTFFLLSGCFGGSGNSGTTPQSTVETIGSNLLKNLAFSGETLVPAFSPEIAEYALTVSSSYVTLSASSASTTAQVLINSQPVSSGANHIVNLTPGLNTIDIVVSDQGQTDHSYRINALRQSNNADLVSLALSDGMLSPVFSATTTNYSASVGFAVSSLTINARLSDSKASMNVAGNSVLSGNDVSINLVNGDNIIDVVVTAENGGSKTYRLTVTRSMIAQSTDLSTLALSAGVLEPVFDSGVTDYLVNLPFTANDVGISATSVSSSADLFIGGSLVAQASPSVLPLTVGSNIIDIVVNTIDQTSKLYRLNVIRQPPSTDASLSGLTINGGNLKPAFSANTSQYHMLVGSNITSLDISPNANDGNYSSLAINGVAVNSGTSLNVPLQSGSNNLAILVTAQDGMTQQSYNITVTREYAIARGINLPNTNNTVLSTTDVANWRSWGVNTVRISLNKDDTTDPYTNPPSVDNIWLPYAASKARLETWIGWMAANNIQVVVTLDQIWGDDHNTTNMWSNGGVNSYLQHRIDLAVAMADWLSNFDNVIAMEVWNEPHPYSDIYRDYFLPQVVSGVRAINSDLGLILMSPYDWGLPVGLDSWSGMAGADSRIAYSTHIYNPWTYTHQGISGNPLDTEGWPGLHKEYPTSALAYYDLAWVRAQVAKLVAFQTRSGRKVMITEFGVLRWAVNSDLYLADWLTAFEENSISWLFHSIGGWNGWNPTFAANRAESFVTDGGDQTTSLILLKNKWQLNNSQ